MATKREYWGLDLETSGTDHDKHVPIQLGLAAPDGAVKSWLIGGWPWLGTGPDYTFNNGTNRWQQAWKAEWDLRAFEVHGITQERLDLEGYSRWEVTTQAVRFIEEHSDAWHGNRKPVGWNVASFDMPFVRRYLPGVARVLSYQSADLNAICFAISEAHGISYKGVKSLSKDYAKEQLHDTFEEALWHDAGYDAAAGLHSFKYLTDRIKEGY